MKKHKELKITTKLKVTTYQKLTSKVPGYKEQLYVQERMTNFAPKSFWNDDLFGDAFNDSIIVEQR